MLDLYQLEQLVTIAEVGTLSKAAEILLISQPALTRSIQKLEEELGIKLFDRKKNKITLNDTGRLAVDYAKAILDEADRMVTQLQNYDRNKHTISIGACAPTPIWGLKYVFHKLYPEMNVDSELNSTEKILLDGLQSHQYSIIVLNHPIKDDNYICIDLFKENLYLSVPPAHPLALFKEVSFKDLDGESVLLLSRIGFWNEICLKMIPQSHLLIQEDNSVYKELTSASALPNFRSNITIITDENESNRIFIPIIDQEAHAQYYAIFKKEEKKLFAPIKNEANNIDWKKAEALA